MGAHLNSRNVFSGWRHHSGRTGPPSKSRPSGCVFVCCCYCGRRRYAVAGDVYMVGDRQIAATERAKKKRRRRKSNARQHTHVCVCASFFLLYEQAACLRCCVSDKSSREDRERIAILRKGKHALAWQTSLSLPTIQHREREREKASPSSLQIYG